jgi:hypothetical protein
LKTRWSFDVLIVIPIAVAGWSVERSTCNVQQPPIKPLSDTRLGAQAGESKLRQVLGAAGFTRVRRAAETHSNMVLEARP